MRESDVEYALERPLFPTADCLHFHILYVYAYVRTCVHAYVLGINYVTSKHNQMTNSV